MVDLNSAVNNLGNIAGAQEPPYNTDDAPEDDPECDDPRSPAKL